MLRGLLLTLAILLLLTGVTVWWAGKQAAALPEWYRQAEAAGELEPDLMAAGRRAAPRLVSRFGRELLDELTDDDGVEDESFGDRLERRGKLLLESFRRGREVRMTAADLESLVLARLADDDEGRELLAAMRAVRAEIAGGQVELGAVVVPARLPRDRLSVELRSALDRLALLPGVGERELYVGLRATPYAVDGRLLMRPPVRLEVGGLTIGSELAVKLLRPPPAALAAGFEIDLGRVQVREVAVEDGVLVLTLSPRL